ncbi:MAG TPA: MFS transporter [Gaiellaceae bacterium]|nr:MFS transporter [Gaiellaceae bacterium]
MKLWPTGGLWRHPDFIRLWSAETVSQFGTQFTLLALPLVAIDALHVSAFEVAALTTVEFLPFLLVSLPAGVWVDRLRRRPILIAGDLARALLFASVPVAYWTGHLSMAQLYVVAFLGGIATVFFDVAYQSYLPSLVERQQLIDGNAKLEISRAAAQLGGPGLAGIVIDFLRAPAALAFDAVSYVGSALFIFSIRKPESSVRTDAPRRRMREELREGLRWVLRHPYLKNIAACTALFNFWGNMGFAVLLVFARRELHLSPLAIGLAFTLSNIGPLLAAFNADRISSRFGVGRTIIAASIIGAPTFLVIPFAPEGNAALAVLIPAFVIGGLSNVIYNVTQVSLRQAITPERLQGRMNSVMRFIVWGTIPLGSIIGGVLASQIGVKETLIVSGIGCFLPFLPVLFSPVRDIEEMPEPVEDEAAAVLGPLVADAGPLPAEHVGT